MSSSRYHVRHLTWPTNFYFFAYSTPKVPAESVEAPPPTQPSVLKEHATYTRPLPEVAEDDDPFAHFLSPVLEEEDTFDDSNFSAGISPFDAQPDAKKDYFFRARLEEKWETYVARRLLKHSTSSKNKSGSIPAPLPPPFPQSTTPPEEAMPDLIDSDISSPSSPELGVMQWGSPSTPLTSDFEDAFIMNDSDLDAFIMNDSDLDADMMDGLDGWEGDRHRYSDSDLTFGSPTRRPRTNSLRTLSGKRHSWREPAWELYTLPEENEEDEEKRRGRNGKTHRRSKTVSWNEEVQVMEFEY